MLSFFPRDVLNEIWDLIDSILEVLLRSLTAKHYSFILKRPVSAFQRRWVDDSITNVGDKKGEGDN